MVTSKSLTPGGLCLRTRQGKPSRPANGASPSDLPECTRTVAAFLKADAGITACDHLRSKGLPALIRDGEISARERQFRI